jgi:hypothetical protein
MDPKRQNSALLIGALWPLQASVYSKDINRGAQKFLADSTAAHGAVD